MIKMSAFYPNMEGSPFDKDKVIEHIAPTDMERRYLSLADGTIAEKAIDVYQFVNAMM